MLTKDTSIPRIPAAIKALEVQRNEALSIANQMVVDIPRHPRMKDSSHLADNAVKFAGRTVSVATALKIAFASPPDPQMAHTSADKLRASLPKSLLDLLITVATGAEAAKPAKSPAAKRQQLSVGESLGAAIAGDDAAEDDAGGPTPRGAMASSSSASRSSAPAIVCRRARRKIAQRS